MHTPFAVMHLHFKSYGADGPPLLVLHGLLGSGGNWHTLASRAFAPRFRVFVVDQRNHGRSPHAAEMTYEAMAADVLAFAEAHRLERVRLLGHSMGGKTAMEFALAHPERVERLVVADMGPQAYPATHDALLDALLAVDLREHATRASVEAALAPRVPDAAVRQFLLKNLARDADEGGFYWLPNLEVLRRSYPALTAALRPGRRFDGPSLFVRGSRSPYIRDVDLPGIRALFPRAEVVAIPEAGHWVHADAPQAFAEAVLRFL